jgi:hypothetical protein
MIVLLSVLAALMAPSTVDTPGAPPPPQPAQAAPIGNVNVTAPTQQADDQTPVCKYIAVTGTRFPTRQCRTKAEWTAEAQAARDFVDKASKPPCSAGCKGN